MAFTFAQHAHVVCFALGAVSTMASAKYVVGVLIFAVLLTDAFAALSMEVRDDEHHTPPPPHFFGKCCFFL